MQEPFFNCVHTIPNSTYAQVRTFRTNVYSNQHVDIFSINLVDNGDGTANVDLNENQHVLVQ